MSSLGVVVRLGTKQWTRISSLLRNGTDTALCSAAFRIVRTPNHMSVALLSSKDRHEISTVTDAEHDATQTTSRHKSSLQNSDSADFSFTEGKTTSSDLDVFDEILGPKQESFSSVAKNYDYKLFEWNRQMKMQQNMGLPVELKKIVSASLPKVVSYVLSPQAPPETRHTCLALLLSQKTDDKLTEKMLHHTVDDVIHLPMKVVADIVQTLSTSCQTHLRKVTRAELVRAVVNKRWYEITPKHVVFFMYQLDELFDVRKISYQVRHMQNEEHDVKHGMKASTAGSNVDSEDVSEEAAVWDRDENQSLSVKGTAMTSDEVISVISINLETRAINLADQLKVKDLARVVILIAKWRSRNQTLLNAFIHRLCQADLSDFSFVQLNNLLFSCSTLRIHNDEFLRKVTSHLAQTTPTSPSLACAAIVSMSHLRWDDPELRSKCLSVVADHVSELSSKDAFNVLMSLANLYAVPVSDKEADLVKELSSRVLSSDVSVMERINCAWCLAVLKTLDARTSESVLQTDFIQKFTDATDSQSLASWQKLQDINTAAKYEVKDYSGPFILKEFSDLFKVSSLGSDKTLSSALVNALRKFADLETYVSLTQTLPEGIVIDAVMCANREGEVRPLPQAEKKDEKDSLLMLALQMVPFAGVVSPSQSTTGSYQLTARHLRHLGYVPIQILYTDLRQSQNVLEHINNIKSKIKAAVKESVTPH